MNTLGKLGSKMEIGADICWTAIATSSSDAKIKEDSPTMV